MNRRRLKALVSAKVNLSLNIGGVKGNLHALDSVMASVSLTDAVTICERFDSCINVQFDSPFAVPQANTVTKALELLRAQFGNFGLDVFISKGLPLSGGLGGSSADAAAVIVLVDNLLGLTAMGLKSVATGLQVGSDVPFMLSGGFARVLNVGDEVQTLQTKCKFFMVIASGNRGVDTTLCYRRFDALYPSKIYEPSDNDALVKALLSKDNSAAAEQFKNALYEPACTIVPSVKVTADAVRSSGATTVFMSGSGSCVVGIFGDLESAKRAALRLESEGFWAVATETLNSGMKLL